MPRYSIDKLAGKTVVTDKGAVIGEVADLIADELTGRVLSIVVEEVQKTDKKIVKWLKKDAKNNVLVPYNTVNSVRDMVIIDEKLLQIYVATRRA